MYEIFERLLKQSNISAYRFSKEVGISQTTLSDWKRGRSIPKIDKLKIIAKYFNVSVEYLMGESEQKNKPIADRDELGALLKNPEMKEIYNNLILLSQEGIEKVRDFVKFQREQEKK